VGCRDEILVLLCCCAQVVVSVAEHHSNLVPWQMVCQATGATLRHVGLTKATQEIDVQVA
jgi:cysteine desulfurase/selenocysteine lyase